MRGIDNNARSRKSAILAAATVSALTLAIPGTAFAYCSGSGSSGKSGSGSGDHVSGTTASWDKDWRRDHHSTPPTTVKGNSGGGDGDHGRNTGTCVIDVPTSDQKDGIHQIIIKNGDGDFHVIFVDGSSKPGHYKPCFPDHHNGGKNDNDGNKGKGNGYGTTTTAKATTTTSTSTTSKPADVQPSVQGESFGTTTSTTGAPVTGGSTTTSTTDPGAKVLGESFTAAPAGGTSAGSSTSTSDPGSAPASVLAQDVTSDPSTLAFTGADVVELTGIGLVLVGIGGATLLARRRNSGAHSK